MTAFSRTAPRSDQVPQLKNRVLGFVMASVTCTALAVSCPATLQTGMFHFRRASILAFAVLPRYPPQGAIGGQTDSESPRRFRSFLLNARFPV